MSNLVGVWELESSEHFDEFLKELGVGMIMRKAAGALKPVMTLSQNGDEWTMKVETSAKAKEFKFKDGAVFDDEMNDGSHAKALVKIESPNKIVQEQRDPATNELRVTIVRELVNGKLVQKMTFKDVTATRVFAKKA